MNRRAAALIFMAAATTARANDAELDALPPLWAAFAEPMNEYIEGFRTGVIRYDKLRLALKAWRKMERNMGWAAVK